MVNVPAAAVVPPIANGASQSTPLNFAAFKFDTSVVEDTVRGAVPVAIVECNCGAIKSTLEERLVVE